MWMRAVDLVLKVSVAKEGDNKWTHKYRHLFWQLLKFRCLDECRAFLHFYGFLSHFLKFVSLRTSGAGNGFRQRFVAAGLFSYRSHCAICLGFPCNNTDNSNYFPVLFSDTRSWLIKAQISIFMSSLSSMAIFGQVYCCMLVVLKMAYKTKVCVWTRLLSESAA